MSATQLPPSLNLPPHLSAHKYFFVCTLTVAAWDTLVLSPRSWRMIKAKDGWPVLKILYNFLRLFMPAEFVVVGQCLFFFFLAVALGSNAELNEYQLLHFLIPDLVNK